MIISTSSCGNSFSYKTQLALEISGHTVLREEVSSRAAEITGGPLRRDVEIRERSGPG